MATRAQVRIAVVQLLYAKDLGNEQAISGAAVFLDSKKIRHKQQEFALFLLHGICQDESLIMQVMEVFVKEWDIGRLGIIEKNILKLGIFELLKTKTQKAIVINEAIELTKIFNIEDACKLVNGVLDNVAKTSTDDIAKLIEERQAQIARSNLAQSVSTESPTNSNKSHNTTKKQKNNHNKKRLPLEIHSKTKRHSQSKKEVAFPKYNKIPLKQNNKKSSSYYDNKQSKIAKDS
ncbi:transcription antitermination factor NusB [Helicobacter aurati]|uniref:Transcription antitermination protein NusB n=1 Tax=Helicobacter aurati TaxID=137778 RepID=A0A3D8J018_9HELI|nr:transcription antitermination factor NusB [Helicobacter aurati]RDU70505.1 transcription antitermination factor NusB [Helicobacter aurati]